MPTPNLIMLRLPTADSPAWGTMEAIGGPLGLARAIGNAPMWADVGSATIAVRPGHLPRLSIIGRFDVAASARITSLQWQIDYVLPRILLLDYAQVEKGVHRMAAVLVERFGRAALRAYRFAAIPRGGHIVLGMLGYALALDSGQFEAISPDTRRMIVVDDCALSGFRFRQVLAKLPGGTRVVFAPLVSTPELRAAIERDPRVAACVSSIDLRDAAPEQLGAGHVDWEARWHRRQHGASYWVGRPQHVCFPWNEPDLGVWNQVTEREEQGWPLIPPERCLKHRAAGREPRAEVQIEPTARGPLRPAESIRFGTFEGQVVIAAPGWPACLSLEGVAASMWSAIVAHGTLAAAAVAVAHEFGIEVDRVLADMEGFAAKLRQRGALVG